MGSIGFPSARSLRYSVLLASLGATACGSTHDTQPSTDPPSDTKRAPEPDGERPAPALVSAQWLNADTGVRLVSSRALTARVTNNTDREQTGALALVASGLDGKLVEQPLRRFRIAAGASELVQVPLSSLPIQSETSAPFVVLEVQADREDGRVTRVSTIPLYYVFSAGYQQVTLHGAEDVVTKLNGGLLVDPSRVDGRVLRSDGTWQTVAPTRLDPDSETITAWTGARVGPAPEIPEAPPPEIDPDMLAANNTLTFCATWRVQFIDSGLGEDDLATSAWQDVPASFVWGRLVKYSPSPSLVWQGRFNVNGCSNPVSVATGFYGLEYDTINISANSVRFDVLEVVNGTPQATTVAGFFETIGGGLTQTITVNPTFNNDAVQATVVASHALAKHVGGPLFGASDMGIEAGTYTIHTSQNCSTGGSCFSPSTGITHIGLSMNQGTPASHWKHVVAHEIGHAVQHRAMGTQDYHYDDTATGVNQNMCRCDHYGPEWSNNLHCLQSREISGAAQKEGFAHAFAARTFNSWSQSNGTFVYYKPFLTTTITFPPMAVNLFSQYRWMENFCVAEGRGVEIDWLTFLYRVSAENAPNFTTFKGLFDIYRRTCTGSVSTDCSGQPVEWGPLLNNALAYYGGSSSNPRYVRFRDTGVGQGVDH